MQWVHALHWRGSAVGACCTLEGECSGCMLYTGGGVQWVHVVHWRGSAVGAYPTLEGGVQWVHAVHWRGGGCAQAVMIGSKNRDRLKITEIFTVTRYRHNKNSRGMPTSLVSDKGGGSH